MSTPQSVTKNRAGARSLSDLWREKPVIAQADANAARQPVHHQHAHERLPGEEEQRSHGANVDADHPEEHSPVDALEREVPAGRTCRTAVSPLTSSGSFAAPAAKCAREVC